MRYVTKACALDRGWDLFEAGHCTAPIDHCAPWSANPDDEITDQYEIQYDQDFPHLLGTDPEAWLHVWGRAVDGSARHVEALRDVAEGDPHEMALILGALVEH